MVKHDKDVGQHRDSIPRVSKIDPGLPHAGRSWIWVVLGRNERRFLKPILIQGSSLGSDAKAA